MAKKNHKPQEKPKPEEKAPEKPPEKDVGGRPPFEFTPQHIEQIKVLARCHCPDSEIAAMVGCGESTLQRTFGALLKEQREIGKSNIRAKQFRMALEGDRTMLIWVGKQILGQRDKFDFDLRKVSDDELMKVVEERLSLPVLPK